MSETISKDLGKEEPEKPKCSMDFSQRKGGWTEHQYSHLWQSEDRKQRSPKGTRTEPMGKEEHRTKEAVQCAQRKRDF
jgi:hypothetical protein